MKTFADAAARYAYYVRPEDVNTEFKQLDTDEVYVASRQGAGAQAWELSYEVGGGGLEDGNYGDITVSSSGTSMLMRGLAIDSGTVSPTIGTDQDNYAIADTTTVVAVAASAAFTFTGFSSNGASALQGRAFILMNLGGAGDFPFFIAHQSASSNAFFGRCTLPNAQRMVVRQGESVWLRLTGLYWTPISIVHGDGQQTLTDAATITFNAALARNATVTLTASRAINFTNVTTGDRGTLRVVQDGSGGHELTDIGVNGSNGADIPGGNISGIASLLSAGASHADILEWFYDGSRLSVWPAASNLYEYQGA